MYTLKPYNEAPYNCGLSCAEVDTEEEEEEEEEEDDISSGALPTAPTASVIGAVLLGVLM